jgi:hypothetical protein
MSTNDRNYQNKILLLLGAVCIVSRVPELVSSKLLLDGDECVVAIMAKHMMQGRAFSAYFYGQSYGFSLVECLFIIPFYFLFGVTTFSVKMGMLLLWTMGVFYLYKAFTLFNKGDKWLPLLLMLLFIWSPAWAVWSMKARGGYLTSFTLTSVVLYLLARDRRSNLFFLAVGVLCFFIYQSQPLWLPGLVPFLGYFLLKDRKAAPALLFMIPVLILSVGVYFYKQGMLEFGTIQADYSLVNLGARVSRIPLLLYYSLHGNYYFDEIQRPNFFCAFLAVVFETLVFSLLLTAVYNVVKGRKGTLLFNLSTLSLLLTLLVTICSVGKQGRYLLPMTGSALFSVLLLPNTVGFRKKIVLVAGYVCIAFGIVALVSFYDFSFLPVRKNQLKQTLGYLEDKGVRYTYCNDNMFTWQVIFYSNEQILCHEKLSPGRFPMYQWRVDSAYYGGAKTAFISETSTDHKVDFPAFEMKDDYYIVIDPPRDIISKEFPRLTERRKYYHCLE